MAFVTILRAVQNDVLCVSLLPRPGGGGSTPCRKFPVITGFVHGLNSDRAEYKGMVAANQIQTATGTYATGIPRGRSKVAVVAIVPDGVAGGLSYFFSISSSMLRPSSCNQPSGLQPRASLYARTNPANLSDDNWARASSGNACSSIRCGSVSSAGVHPARMLNRFFAVTIRRATV